MRNYLAAGLAALLVGSSCADETIGILRLDILVDGGRPIAGERSRMVRSPDGAISFTFTAVAGEHSFVPIGWIRDGRCEVDGLSSETTWNVEGWGASGWPFDLAHDPNGNVMVATRHHGEPYGIDFWDRSNGKWRLTTFGEEDSFGGNNLSMQTGSNGNVFVVGMTRNRSQLGIWRQIGDFNDDGSRGWVLSKPEVLSGVAPGQFSFLLSSEGNPVVVFCPVHGAPVAAYSSDAVTWTRTEIDPIQQAQLMAAKVGGDGRMHVVYGAGAAANDVRELRYAVSNHGAEWTVRTIDRVPVGHHVGLTDIDVVDGRVVVAWEKGLGPQFKPKDYGGQVGSVVLTIVERDGAVSSHTLVEKNGGRPSVAMSADGHTAYVGVYTGNDAGDDFYILACGLGGTDPPVIQPPKRTPAQMLARSCLSDIDSGNLLAERRGLERLDMSQISSAERNELIDRFLEHEDARLRSNVVRELAKSNESIMVFRDRLADIATDSDSGVRHALLSNLTWSDETWPIVSTLLVESLRSSAAMSRIGAAGRMADQMDRFEPSSLRRALLTLVDSLDEPDPAKGGSASIALELLGANSVARESLREVCRSNASALARARAALILFRLGEEPDPRWLEPIVDGAWYLGATTLSGVDDVTASRDEELAQLIVCRLLSEWPSSESVRIVDRLINSESGDEGGSRHASVRTAAVYALRSLAMISELKPVAKHPKGFDLLALRVKKDRTDDENERRDLAIQSLIRCVRHPDTNVRQKAWDSLGRVGAKRVSEQFDSQQTDDDPGVRIAARTARAVVTGDPGAALIDLDDWRSKSATRATRHLNPVFRERTAIVDGVIQVGSDKQLFIDDFAIDRATNVERKLHPFRKHHRNPIFQAQVPWEEGWADPFMSTVLYDPDERAFKMWYRCGPRHSLKGYAVSEDGIHWERPQVAASAWQEFERHNLLGFDGRIETWKRPGNNVQYFGTDADVNQRFASFFYRTDKKYLVSYSPDGVTWSQPVVAQSAYGDVVSVVHDPARKRFLYFPKYMRQVDGFVRRSFAAAELERLDGPYRPVFGFVADRDDDATVAEDASRAYGSLLKDTVRLKEFHSEIYSVTAIPYEGAVVALYDSWPVIGNREGPLDMRMKVSRDMQTWTDVDSPKRALSIGRLGEWDSGMVYGGNTMLVVDDEIRLYYLGANMGHCTKVLPMTRPYHTLGVGLATLRLDGFASLQADAESGEVITKRMQFSGDQLRVNANCSNGRLRVELLDANENPIDGYRLDQCDPISSDSLRHVVTWKGKHETAAMAGRTVKVRFVFDKSDLYAFQFQSVGQ